jgi:predicted nuclease of restriction endonuclease-like (RecB) superfamily
MSDIQSQTQYSDFVLSIKQRILQSQYEALKSVNKELIALYWDIGKSIVEKQDAFGWGKSVVKTLAEDLQKEFVGMKGFSVQNLWNMRLFYLEYRDHQKLQTLSREIGWQKQL